VLVTKAYKIYCKISQNRFQMQYDNEIAMIVGYGPLNQMVQLVLIKGYQSFARLKDTSIGFG
jgi:hypothetical protein